MKLYQIASIGLTDENKWGVTYFGSVPEQGGLEFKRGQVFFETFESALDFMRYQITQHVSEYEKLIQNKGTKE